MLNRGPYCGNSTYGPGLTSVSTGEHGPQPRPVIEITNNGAPEGKPRRDYRRHIRLARSYLANEQLMDFEKGEES